MQTGHGPRAWRATTSCTSTPSPTPSLEEHTQRNQPVKVGRVYPNHPAALRLGTQMGSDSPGQHEYIFSTKSHALLPKTMRDTPEGGSCRYTLCSSLGYYVHHIWFVCLISIYFEVRKHPIVDCCQRTLIAIMIIVDRQLRSSSCTITLQIVMRIYF